MKQKECHPWAAGLARRESSRIPGILLQPSLPRAGYPHGWCKRSFTREFASHKQAHKPRTRRGLHRVGLRSDKTSSSGQLGDVDFSKLDELVPVLRGAVALEANRALRRARLAAVGGGLAVDPGLDPVSFHLDQKLVPVSHILEAVRRLGELPDAPRGVIGVIRVDIRLKPCVPGRGAAIARAQALGTRNGITKEDAAVAARRHSKLGAKPKVLVVLFGDEPALAFPSARRVLLAG